MATVGLIGGAASTIAAAQALLLAAGKIVLSIRSSFSVDTELRNHVAEVYKTRWLIFSTVFSSLPHFIQTAELRVLDGTEETISKFRKDQETLLANTGTTAAIISQVTVTSIQLGNVEQMHWIVRGCFYSSLVFSIFAVFLSFLKHRDITSMNNFDMRSRLVFRPRRVFRDSWDIDHPRTDPYRPTQLNMTIVLALYLPYALLNAAISTYFLSLLLYLVFSWMQLPNVDGSSTDNRNIFILFVSSLTAGYFALISVQRSRLHFVNSAVDSYDAQKLVNCYPDHFPPSGRVELSRILENGKFRPEGFDGKGFMKLFEHIEHTYSTTRLLTDEDRVLAGVTSGSPSDTSELLKAILDAAESNKAAAAAIQEVAAQLEKLTTSLMTPKTSSGGVAMATNIDPDAITLAT